MGKINKEKIAKILPNGMYGWPEKKKWKALYHRDLVVLDDHDFALTLAKLVRKVDEDESAWTDYFRDLNHKAELVQNNIIINIINRRYAGQIPHCDIHNYEEFSFWQSEDENFSPILWLQNYAKGEGEQDFEAKIVEDLVNTFTSEDETRTKVSSNDLFALFVAIVTPKPQIESTCKLKPMEL